MSHVFKTYVLKCALALIALGTASVLPARASNDVECYANWSDAAPIVARERLMPANGIQAIARRDLDGDVVRLTLCRSGADYIYRIVLRDARGRHSSHVMSARGTVPTNVASDDLSACSGGPQLHRWKGSERDLCR